MGSCDFALLIYDAPKFCNLYQNDQFWAFSGDLEVQYWLHLTDGPTMGFVIYCQR